MESTELKLELKGQGLCPAQVREPLKAGFYNQELLVVVGVSACLSLG